MRVFAPGIVVEYEFEMRTTEGCPKLIYFVVGKAEAGACIESHAHPYYEVVLLAEGTCFQRVDSDVYQLRANDLIITKPGQTHEIFGANDMGWRHYCLAFDASGLPDVNLALSRSHLSHIPECHDLVRICARIHEESRQPKLGLSYMVQSLVTEVLVGIARRTAHSEMSQVLHPYSPEVELARVYIERHSRHGLSIDEIARAVCASPSHLARRFSREMHIPIHCYTRRLLMQRAASLLEQGTLNVSEIAEHLGFSSIHFFSSSFKDYWGMSPTQYRQSISTLG